MEIGREIVPQKIKQTRSSSGEKPTFEIVVQSNAHQLKEQEIHILMKKVII